MNRLKFILCSQAQQEALIFWAYDYLIDNSLSIISSFLIVGFFYTASCKMKGRQANPLVYVALGFPAMLFYVLPDLILLTFDSGIA